MKHYLAILFTFLCIITSAYAQKSTTNLDELVIKQTPKTSIKPNVKHYNYIIIGNKNLLIEVFLSSDYKNKLLTKITIPYRNWKTIYEGITESEKENRKVALEILDDTFEPIFQSDTLEFNLASRKLKYLEIDIPDRFLITDKPIKMHLKVINDKNLSLTLLNSDTKNTAYNTKIYGFGTIKNYSLKELYTNPSLSMKTDYLINLGFEFEDEKIE